VRPALRPSRPESSGAVPQAGADLPASRSAED